MIRIAIADDHAIVRNGLVSILDRIGGFRVDIEAEDGHELLEKIKRAKELPHVCLLDITMPRMDGFDTIVALKEKWPDMGVLVLTVHNDDRYIIRMIQHKANGYLSKNCKAEELRDAILSIHNEGIYYSDAESRKFIRAVAKNEIDLPKLTAIELILLRWVCTTDLKYDIIAQKMGLTGKSVEAHKEALFKKLKVDGRVGLTLFAVRFGYIQVDVFSAGNKIFAGGKS